MITTTHVPIFRHAAKTIAAIAVVMLLAPSFIAAEVDEPHLVLYTRSVPTSIRSAGIGMAGVAVPGGIASVTNNPAMMHTQLDYDQMHTTAMVSYGRDTLFDRHVLGAGAGMRLGSPMSVGLLYRYLKAEDEPQPGEDGRRWHSEILLNVSGRLFDKNINHGVVNLGLNVRYQRSHWDLGEGEQLWTTRTINDTIVDSFPSTRDRGYVGERRLLFDLGLFQMEIGQGVDFGVSITNLFGYYWQSRSPYAYTTHTVKWDTLQPGDSLVEAEWVDSAYYKNDTLDSKDWVNDYYRTITAGIAFHKHLLEDRVFINLPIDVEVFGLFDREHQSKLAVRVGLEAWIKGQYCARFGYARMPISYPGDLSKIQNANVFGGGAGIRVGSFGIDVFVRRKALGISAEVLL